MDASLRARLSSEAQRSARARFTVQAQVRAYETMYTDLIGHRPVRAANAVLAAPGAE